MWVFTGGVTIFANLPFATLDRLALRNGSMKSGRDRCRRWMVADRRPTRQAA